jgi:hypothetical protein
MYKLTKELPVHSGIPKQIIRLLDGACIPFDPANTDYQRFKNELQGIDVFGASITPVELQDAEGNTMTTEEVEEFVSTLP